MTSHLYRFFPVLENREILVPEGSVADVVRSVNEITPGFSDYVLNDYGAQRRHVLISINDNLIVDRNALTDRVAEDGTVYIFQALSGG